MSDDQMERAFDAIRKAAEVCKPFVDARASDLGRGIVLNGLLSEFLLEFRRALGLDVSPGVDPEER